MNDWEKLAVARMRLVETGGRASHDFGTGRIVGQVLVYLYLQEHECSLDDIGDSLGLSKASVSIAVRQLEQLGLAVKVWKAGDKKKYYKSAENLANALQQGVLSMVRQKVQIFGNELETGLRLIGEIPSDSPAENESAFLKARFLRAQKLQTRLQRFLGNPLLKLFTKLANKKGS